jgi:hypothetical protein
VRVTSGEVREVCAPTVSDVRMYFDGVETEEPCTKLDAEPSRGMSTDSTLCRTARPEIAGPGRGYGMNKVVEMLHGEHIRGLSKEMQRASVLMAFRYRLRWRR